MEDKTQNNGAAPQAPAEAVVSATAPEGTETEAKKEETKE